MQSITSRSQRCVYKVDKTYSLYIITQIFPEKCPWKSLKINLDSIQSQFTTKKNPQTKERAGWRIHLSAFVSLRFRCHSPVILGDRRALFQGGFKTKHQKEKKEGKSDHIGVVLRADSGEQHSLEVFLTEVAVEVGLPEDLLHRV